MKNRKVFPIFMLISMWSIAIGYGQSFHSPDFSTYTASLATPSGPLNLEKGHPVNLNLHTDTKDPGRCLRKTGAALIVAGLATTALSIWGVARTYSQIPLAKPNPETQAYKNAVFLNRLSAAGAVAGASATLTGSVIWIIGAQKSKRYNRNSGE